MAVTFDLDGVLVLAGLRTGDKLVCSKGGGEFTLDPTHVAAIARGGSDVLKDRGHTIQKACGGCSKECPFFRM